MALLTWQKAGTCFDWTPSKQVVTVTHYTDYLKTHIHNWLIKSGSLLLTIMTSNLKQSEVIISMQLYQETRNGWHSLSTTAKQAAMVWAWVAKKDSDWEKKCMEHEVEGHTFIWPFLFLSAEVPPHFLSSQARSHFDAGASWPIMDYARRSERISILRGEGHETVVWVCVQ